MTNRPLTRQEVDAAYDERVWPKTLKKILRANLNLAARVKAGGLLFDYFAEADRLSVFLKVPCPALGDYLSDDDSFVAFYHDDTHVIDGFEYLFFSETMKKRPSKDDLWSMAYAYLKEGRFVDEYPSSYYHAPPEDLAKLGKALQDLLPKSA